MEGHHWRHKSNIFPLLTKFEVEIGPEGILQQTLECPVCEISCRFYPKGMNGRRPTLEYNNKGIPYKGRSSSSLLAWNLAAPATNDEHHERAKEIFSAIIKGEHGRPIITSLPVIIETAMFVHRKSRGPDKKDKACKRLKLIFEIIERYKIDIIDVQTEELLRRGKELYFERNGQVDFVDAIVVFMKLHKCSKIVSFDDDYDQFANEGITRVY